MVHVTDGAYVAVRLGALKLFFCHTDLFFPEGYCFLKLKPKGRGSFYLLIGDINIETFLGFVKGKGDFF
jgi:hypothetical protein